MFSRPDWSSCVVPIRAEQITRDCPFSLSNYVVPGRILASSEPPTFGRLPDPLLWFADGVADPSRNRLIPKPPPQVKRATPVCESVSSHSLPWEHEPWFGAVSFRGSRIPTDTPSRNAAKSRKLRRLGTPQLQVQLRDGSPASFLHRTVYTFGRDILDCAKI